MCVHISYLQWIELATGARDDRTDRKYFCKITYSDMSTMRFAVERLALSDM